MNSRYPSLQYGKYKRKILEYKIIIIKLKGEIGYGYLYKRDKNL